MKVKVRITESIAGLGDPRPKADLDAKYQLFRDQLKAKEKPPSDGTIKLLIDDKKKADRYGEGPIGFSKDWSFRPNDIAMIDSTLAEKWEESGICVRVTEDNGNAGNAKK